MNDDGRALLRHTVATLAYRSRKVLRDAPEGFADVRAAPGSRRAGRILAHMGDLLDWGCHLANGEHIWNDSRPLPWYEEVGRYYGALETFDRRLAGDAPLQCTPERLFQGPVADALWHLGQLALLRRVGDAPIRGENYFRAEITSGRVGPDQAEPRREFG
jgi:hypothetical protein